MITIVSMLIALTTMFLISTMLNRRFSDLVNNNIKSNSTQLINGVSDNIDMYIKEMNLISNDFADKVQDQEIINVNKQKPIFFLEKDIENIMLIDSRGKVHYASGNGELRDNNDLTEASWFDEVTPGTRRTELTAPHVQQYYVNDFKWVISMVKGISWKDEAGQLVQGFTLLDLNFSNLRNLCSNFVENGYIFIINDDNEIIFHPQQQSLYLGAKHKELELITKQILTGDSQPIIDVGSRKVMVTSHEIKNTNWRLVGVAPVKGIFERNKGFRLFVILLLFTVFLFVLIASLVTSRMITKPIYKLIDLMRRVENGTLDSYSDVNGLIEVEQLSKSYNNMIHSLKRMMNQIIKDRDDIRKAEIRTLYNQINPHFLYNTLDSIMWLAENGEKTKVVQMIDSLATFFRLSVAKGRDMLKVTEELRHVESYLAIQQVRFSNQYQYYINMEEEVADCLVPKITLQPLVENAIIHGVTKLDEPGNIWINAYKLDGNLMLEVIDDGIGMSEKTVDILNNSSFDGHGIGVTNLKQRIEINYGKRFGIKIESQQEEGTKVTVKLPLIKEEKR